MNRDPIPTDCETVEAVAHALADTRHANETGYRGLAAVEEAAFVRGAVVLYLGDAAPPEIASHLEGIQTRWQQMKSRIYCRAEVLEVELGYRRS